MKSAMPTKPSAGPTMSEPTPDVSVIIPAYGVERYLDQALKSVREQTHANIEIICINDGSRDNSLAIMQEHAANDSRIRVIDKENEGYGATCNRGIDGARGTWIAILEPDDWILPTMFEDMLAHASTFSERIDIIKTPYWRIWLPDTPQEQRINCSYRHRVKAPQPFSISQATHLIKHHPSIWSALYRTEFLREKAIRFREIPGAGWADNPFLIETLCQTDRIIYLDTPYYCYREETPEKTTAFAQTNAHVAFERWCDMMDIIEKLNVTGPAILSAHNSRGFSYLNGIIEEVGFEQPELREQARTLFVRMNPELVLADPEIPPALKEEFFNLRGEQPPRSIKRWPYRVNLIKQGLYFLRNSGIRNTWAMVTGFISKGR